MKKYIQARPYGPDFSYLREMYNFPSGISGCYINRNGSYSIRFGTRADRQLRFPIINPEKNTIHIMDFSKHFTDVSDLKLLNDGYIVRGMAKEQNKQRKKYRFYITDHDGKITKELHMSSIWSCAQIESGYILLSYLIEDRIEDELLDNGLVCLDAEGNRILSTKIPLIYESDFVSSCGNTILFGNGKGYAVMQNGDTIIDSFRIAYAGHKQDCVAFSPKTMETISFSQPHKENERFFFHISSPTQVPDFFEFLFEDRSVFALHGDAAGDKVLIADKSRCYIYNI